MTLYHYTCDHGRQGIGSRGQVLPLIMHSPAAADRLPPAARWMASCTWFTDLDCLPTSGAALGLTSQHLSCDRTAYRYIADPSAEPRLQHWPPNARTIAPRRHINALNRTPGAMPMHWWITTEPVPCTIDATWRAH